MARIVLTLVVLVATVGVMVQSLPSFPPLPTPTCQRWCPRPGQLGEYDCCDGPPSCPVSGPFGCAPATGNAGGTCRSTCLPHEYEEITSSCGSCSCCKTFGYNPQ